VKSDDRVLEIGCGSAGVLSAFLERGCSGGAGVDISEHNIAVAKKKLAGRKDVILLAKDIYKIDVETDLDGKFDIIVLKDVIEHIPNQEQLISQLKSLLRPNGKIFVGFPPWQMPFGGHQQILQSRVLSRIPYLHLLPTPVYRWVMRLFNNYSFVKPPTPLGDSPTPSGDSSTPLGDSSAPLKSSSMPLKSSSTPPKSSSMPLKSSSMPPKFSSIEKKFSSTQEEELIQIKQTGISIERFERIAKNAGYKVINRQFHLVNPIYQYKFGMKMRKQYKFISAIPYIRNFLTTSAFYLIKPK
ncbi:MAG: class I SAM-dependent methyltransferase, partial [Dysgonamonadaceae bacterium]|nr:class I SAM-dependent methyltransferase [Dysgonamonadaceae bacterium]